MLDNPTFRLTLLLGLVIATLATLFTGHWSIGLWLTLATTIATLFWWGHEKSLKPIESYVDAANEVRNGTFNSQTVPRDVPNAWQPLSDAFRQMGIALADREDSLLSSSASLEAVLASMSEGVLAIDEEGNLIMANQAACQMLAMSESNVIGRKLTEQLRIPELTAAIENARQQKTRTECEFQTLSEPRRTISARLTSIQASNEASATAIVLHDVTGIRQLENMRRDFVANVSHELKTPLSVIKAYAETLRMGAVNDQNHNMEFLGHIESQADLLDRQIQDLLQLARIEADKVTLEIDELELNELCLECYRQLEEVARRREITLVTELTDRPVMVDGDAEAFRTILKNLISNAIQYTPAHGTVTIVSQLNDGLAQIDVIDTGIGISPEQQTRIFERFYRADKARSRDMGGTGLGLAIVKHLTTSLGGSVSVESKIGKGSRFRVTFAQPS